MRAMAIRPVIQSEALHDKLNSLENGKPIRIVMVPCTLQTQSTVGAHGGVASSRNTGGLTPEHADLKKHGERLIKRLQNDSISINPNGTVQNGRRTIKFNQNLDAISKAKRIVVNKLFEIGGTGVDDLSKLIPTLQRTDSVIYVIAHGGKGALYMPTPGLGATEDCVFTARMLVNLIDSVINKNDDLDKASIRATFKIMACQSGTDVDGQDHSNFASLLYKSFQGSGYINVKTRGYNGFVGEDSKVKHSYASQTPISEQLILSGKRIKMSLASKVAVDYPMSPTKDPSK